MKKYMTTKVLSEGDLIRIYNRDIQGWKLYKVKKILNLPSSSSIIGTYECVLNEKNNEKKVIKKNISFNSPYLPLGYKPVKQKDDLLYDWNVFSISDNNKNCKGFITSGLDKYINKEIEFVYSKLKMSTLYKLINSIAEDIAYGYIDVIDGYDYTYTICTTNNIIQNFKFMFIKDTSVLGDKNIYRIWVL